MSHDLPPVWSRRRLLARCALGTTAFAASGWLRQLAAGAPEALAGGKAIVLLWMNGGPSTIDLWDPKPGHENGGPFRAIETAAPGLAISEHLPGLAEQARDLAIVRSLTSREGDHGRATFFARTGYKPQGGVDFADLGAVVAHELGEESADLPNFVSIAPPRRTRFAGSGFLGPEFAPLRVGEMAVAASDLKVDELTPHGNVSTDALVRRQRVLTELNAGFVAGHDTALVHRYATAASRANRMMRPEIGRAFDLEEESDAIRDSYGRGLFGQGCLLARRLVERGVPFVEVSLDGWDTHQNNFERVRGLSGQLDRGFAGLIADLRDRGLLDSTLVVCMGEFGRTPNVNANAGRDHWPRSWAAALAGGGIRGGGAIGRTSPDGKSVVEAPHHVPDLIATVCQAVGIDPRKQNMSNVGRPIRVADPEARVIEGLL